MKMKLKTDKPLTLLFKDGIEDIEAEGFLVLDPEAALYHGTRVNPARLHARTREMLALVFTQPEQVEEAILKSSRAGSQVLGFIDLTLKLLDKGVTRIQWRYPEAGIHPKYQTGLADVAIAILGLGKEGGAK